MGNKAANGSTLVPADVERAGSAQGTLASGNASLEAEGASGHTEQAGGQCVPDLRFDLSVDAEALNSGSESNEADEASALETRGGRRVEGTQGSSMASLAANAPPTALMAAGAGSRASAARGGGDAAAGFSASENGGVGGGGAPSRARAASPAADEAIAMALSDMAGDDDGGDGVDDGESSLGDHRPPALELNGASEPSLDTHSRGSSGDEANAAGSKGAHVEVAVFKYQPGNQAPVENLQNYRISQRGAALTGGLGDSGHSRASRGSDGGGGASGRVDIATEYEKRKGAAVDRHHIQDHRAKQLLVVPSDDKFVAVAAPEAFSRHSGTCMILGGQGAYSHGSSKSYELKLGNFLRIGSVGVVVSEIHTGTASGVAAAAAASGGAAVGGGGAVASGAAVAGGAGVAGGAATGGGGAGAGEYKCLSWEELTCLKGDIAAIQKDLVTLEALTAQEEDSQKLAKAGGGAAAVAAAAAAAGGKMCYMCFDDADDADNPLVAPCECKGDTRYVHLNCLQKWHTTSSENKVCVILNNKGVRVCTVCKSPYKASVRLPGGESVSLFQSPLPPPYICFMVVTRHQNNEDLFSTKYQLSFSSVLNRQETGGVRGLVLGRSRTCDMVLDYRTVSTKHASIRYQNGRFYFSDMNSSNGSYLYLREPLQLPYGETVYLKWGSNVVSLKAKRSIRNRLSTLVSGRRGGGGAAGAGGRSAGSMQDYSMLESLCELGQSPTRPPSGERHSRRGERERERGERERGGGGGVVAGAGAEGTVAAAMVAAAATTAAASVTLVASAAPGAAASGET